MYRKPLIWRMMLGVVLGVGLTAAAPGLADVVFGPWSTGPNMLQGLEEIRGAALGGKFYVVGGRDGEGAPHSGKNTVQVYD